MDFNNVRDRLKNVGVINSEEEMGNLLGKGESYVSSRKSKNEPPSLDALTHMAFNLEKEIQDFEDELRQGNPTPERWEAASTIWELQNELFEEIRQKVGYDRKRLLDEIRKDKKL